MSEEKISPLRQRMIEDMCIRGIGEKTQQQYIRSVKDFTRYLGRSPDTATAEDVRGYQLHMSRAEVGWPTFNSRTTALRFFFRSPATRRI